MSPIWLFFLGLIAGFAAFFFGKKSSPASMIKLEMEKKQLEKELENQKQHYEARMKEREIFQQKEVENQKQSYEKQMEDRKKDQAIFKNIARDALRAETEEHQKINKKSLDEILNPLKTKITDFEKTVKDCYEEEGKERFSLKTEVEKIAKTNQNLTEALKGDTKAQGNWGEMILERMLENCGLKEGEHFTVQKTLTNDDGQMVRPDIVMHLPEERDIIIDSKVSLTSYHNYISSKSAVEKEENLKQIIHSLQQHIKNLSEKKYAQSKGLKNSLDFVLMFIPMEGALSLAFQAEKNLFDQAFKKSIIIVSPITLYATLKTIHTLWQIENQSKNAKEIANESGKMYDKFMDFLKDMQSVKGGLNKAQDNYDQALKKLQTGRGNLISRSEKIKKLGASTNKNLPEDFQNHTLPSHPAD